MQIFGVSDSSYNESQVPWQLQSRFVSQVAKTFSDGVNWCWWCTGPPARSQLNTVSSVSAVAVFSTASVVHTFSCQSNLKIEFALNPVLNTCEEWARAPHLRLNIWPQGRISVLNKVYGKLKMIIFNLLYRLMPYRLINSVSMLEPRNLQLLTLYTWWLIISAQMLCNGSIL